MATASKNSFSIHMDLNNVLRQTRKKVWITVNTDNYYDSSLLIYSSLLTSQHMNNAWANDGNSVNYTENTGAHFSDCQYCYSSSFRKSHTFSFKFHREADEGKGLRRKRELPERNSVCWCGAAYCSITCYGSLRNTISLNLCGRSRNTEILYKHHIIPGDQTYWWDVKSQCYRCLAPPVNSFSRDRLDCDLLWITSNRHFIYLMKNFTTCGFFIFSLLKVTEQKIMLVFQVLWLYAFFFKLIKLVYLIMVHNTDFVVFSWTLF